MNKFIKKIIMGSIILFMNGCQQQATLEVTEKIQPMDTPKIYDGKPLKVSGERIALPSLTSLINSKQKNIEPLILDHMILSADQHHLVLIDKLTSSVLHKLSGMSVQSQPVFSHGKIYLTTAEHGLVTLSYPQLEIIHQIKIEAPLLTTPLVLENGDIFVQYIHNYAQLFSSDLISKWKVSLPVVSNYNQFTDYKPNADNEAIFVALSGGGLVSLDQKTGVMRWNYRAADDLKQRSILDSRQVTNPINLYKDKLIMKLSDGLIKFLDKDTGVLIDSVKAKEESPLIVQDGDLVFVNINGNIASYDLTTMTENWVNTQLTKYDFNSLSILDAKLVANTKNAHLFLMNLKNGELISHYVHQYQQARLLSGHQNDTIYGVDKFGIFFKITPETFT